MPTTSRLGDSFPIILNLRNCNVKKQEMTKPMAAEVVLNY